MISISGKKWIEERVNKNSIEKIKQDFNFSELLSRLIVLRNFNLTEIHNIDNILEVKNVFLNNSDFNKGAKILIKSIENKENICILGDYDVDGSAATSLLIRFFNFIKQRFFFHIPDREKDGYGATKKLFEKLILKKPKLVIMVDCGSTSNEAINFLNKNNIKSIIIDHHEIHKPYPASDIIINPKKNNGYQKYNYLCATSLTYFFIDLINKKQKINFNLSDFLIYVLLATVCDVMPIRKLNRLIALKVIKDFNINKNIAIKYLYQLTNKQNKLTIDDLGYFIGPIINSGGRLGKSLFATELLSSNDQKQIKTKSIDLIKLNEKRKEIEKKILDQIDFKDIFNKNKNVIIYYNANINEGLIGIIASRLKDYFDKPSIVITNSKNLLKGSARSNSVYNIGNIIKNLHDNKIIINGGGHNMAAGFTMKKENFEIFEDFIQKDFDKKNFNIIKYDNYDLEISTTALNNNFIDEINKLAPFGNENKIPTFLLKNLKIIKTKILNNTHISAILKSKNGLSIKSISFNVMNTKLSEYLLSYKKDINVIAQIHQNIWNNKKTIQLNIKDIFI